MQRTRKVRQGFKSKTLKMQKTKEHMERFSKEQEGQGRGLSGDLFP